MTLQKKQSGTGFEPAKNSLQDKFRVNHIKISAETADFR